MTSERPADSRPPAATPADDWQDDGAYASGAPEHDFAVRRVTLIVLLVAAIVLPCIYVSVMAYNDLKAREAAASDVTMRTVRVAEEHALKVFDLTETLDARIVDLVQDMDDATVRRQESDIHEALNTIGGGYPQVAAVSIFGASGMLLANSLYYPAPYASIANRDDFVGIRDGKVIEHISRLMMGPLKLENIPVFNTGVARRHSDGSFAGMVSIALKSSYFNAFYRNLLGGSATPMTMALARSDGAVIASYPPPPSLAHTDRTATFGNPHNDPRAGVVRVGHDGAGSEIVAYRQVGSYPVYVTCAYRTSAIWHEWYEHLSVLFISMFAPSIALWWVIWLSLKRLKAEEQAWDRWQAEASMRRSIESAYRQSRKMQALGNLVGSVAHDFNNLLMIISSNVQIVRRRGVAQLDMELAAIERALKNGQSLTRQLLGVARKQPLHNETIDVGQWLGTCRELLKTSLGSKSSLVVAIEPGVWPVRIDVAELELAVINLAVNARDAMPAGGRFTVGARNVTLRREDGFPLTGDFVQISLDDTGIGMAPDVLARAFEPLFTTKGQGMGTGLGLPQVFAFCERSGGLATIDSAVGAGTSVRLYLPRARAEDIVVRPPAAVHDGGALTGLHVLLVEDNGEVAAGTEALLTLLGHRVTYAPTADDALRLIEGVAANDAFDLVISDIHMPGRLNGIDLAEAVGKRPDKLPVILVTGLRRGARPHAHRQCTRTVEAVRHCAARRDSAGHSRSARRCAARRPLTCARGASRAWAPLAGRATRSGGLERAHPIGVAVDEALQERTRVVTDDAAFVVDTGRIVLDEHFRLREHLHVEIREHVAQVLLRERRADRARRRAEHRARLARPRVVPPRARAPVERVLQHAGNRAVVFGRDEQQRVGRFDRLFETLRDFRKIRVVILTIERQLADLDELEREIGGRERNHGVRQCAIPRTATQTADDDRNAMRHGFLLPMGRESARLLPSRRQRSVYRQASP